MTNFNPNPNPDYKPRLSIEITEDQQQRLNNLLGTYGIKRSIFSIIIDDLLDLIELHGQVIVGILLDEAIKPHKIIPSLSKANKIGKSLC